MSSSNNGVALLEAEYLPVRAKILEIAASLDRLDRASGEVEDHPDWQQIQQALEIVLSDCPSRAEQVQLLFSRPYDENWRENLGLDR